MTYFKYILGRFKDILYFFIMNYRHPIYIEINYNLFFQ
jgi:hypothetical protein